MTTKRSWRQDYVLYVPFSHAVLGVGDWPSAKSPTFFDKWPGFFKCTDMWLSFAHPLNYLFDFAHLTSQVKDGHWTETCPNHVQLLVWCFQLQKQPPLSPGIEPATFRYNGQRANHWTTTAPLRFNNVVNYIATVNMKA